jgi:type III pantothenate kinase
MIWAVLIGNTRCVSALMDGTRVLKRHALPTSRLRKNSDAGAWARALRRLSPAQRMLIASVVPPLDKNARQAVRNAFGFSPIFVTSKSSLGIQVKVKRPSQVGADRLANAVAARVLYGAPSIVVDFGTGTTFDVVDKSGAYCGGAILPGVGISLRALHDFTAKIPLVQFQPVRYAIGKTTEEAVRSGIYHGAIGTTRELLLKIRKEMRVPAPAIATGGWCRVFKGTGLFPHIEPDLTLKGLALIWKNMNQL